MVRRRYYMTGGSEAKFVFVSKDLAYVGNKIKLPDDVNKDVCPASQEDLWTIERVFNSQ